MALFNGEGFNELLSDLKTNGDMLDVAAPEILEAGAAVVADAWRDAIKAHNLIDSGDMLESVGHSEIVNTETEKRLPFIRKDAITKAFAMRKRLLSIITERHTEKQRISLMMLKTIRRTSRRSYGCGMVSET